MTYNANNSTDQVQGHVQAGGLLGTMLADNENLIVAGQYTVTQIVGQNASATTLWLQLFDLATGNPTAGAVPLAQVLVGYGTSTYPTENARNGIAVTVQNGVYLAWSTTPGILTLESSSTGLNAEVYGV